jgi:hypothetical protein
MGSANKFTGPASAWLRGLLFVAVWSLYAVALFVPALKGRAPHHACTAPDLIGFGTAPGWQALLLGWMPIFCIPWSANLFLLVGSILLLCGRYEKALRLGVFGVLAGLTTLALWRWGVVETLLVGYFCWQAGLLLFALGAGALWWKYGGGECVAKPVLHRFGKRA